MKIARRLKLKSDAFEILGLTALVAIAGIFLASLGVVRLAPFAILVLQIGLLVVIYVFIQQCVRRQSQAVFAEVKIRFSAELAALRGSSPT